MSRHNADLLASLNAAILEWQGLMTEPADLHDDAAADAQETALARCNSVADEILAILAPTAADLPAMGLAFAWRCAGGVPPTKADPDLHDAAVRLIAAFKTPRGLATQRSGGSSLGRLVRNFPHDAHGAHGIQ